MSRKPAGPRLTPRRARLVKALTLCMVFSLLVSLAFSTYFRTMNGFSAIVEDSDIELIQLEQPAAGAPKATVHTTLGDMAFVLYPEQCPETVKNFTELANSGYYDNTYVFRVEQNVFFSAGSPQQDGSLSDADISSPQEHVPQELSPKLWPFRGALCALTTSSDSSFWKIFTNTRKYYSGSRFLVCDTIEMTDEIKEALTADTEGKKADLANAFIEQGGIPNYSQQLTIFGQLTDGSDVLDAITSAALTGAENETRPKEDILILSVEIGTYE